MSSSYERVRSQVVQALEALLQTKEIQVENAEVVWRAVRLYRASAADLSDCLMGRCQKLRHDLGGVRLVCWRN